jgi:hypothetical protein
MLKAYDRHTLVISKDRTSGTAKVGHKEGEGKSGKRVVGSRKIPEREEGGTIDKQIDQIERWTNRTHRLRSAYDCDLWILE